ncbi:hypothetical protein SAMN02746095_03859 [Acidocella aminolytica 101 = DSM 11237]|uniref:Uncharacterized protein n=1 Tax=Acidocella aminolytica 101 = DSM 11237 TaxID=1120923 RepID=A0A0D6PI90_9PROT|nr:hypothetical protein [Acidocella aminolytica]GAN81091.1 hypothetical protein Aam_075_004 [Acidocella aminolytica 101 = DSM 11237]GBQ40300.1 hypothetical protein AA11237_2320 [Acidocella aminolytica 101 = DSM 11237]SHF61029.1 hypothetical protein SAMN02746095_03859 [Acidocella aminolytica 101 = DSM 11237]
MSRALGNMLLMMFGGHGSSREQDLRELPQEKMPVEEHSTVVPRKAKPKPVAPRLIGPLTVMHCHEGA